MSLYCCTYKLQPAHEPECWGPESPWWRVRAEAGYSSTRVRTFGIVMPKGLNCELIFMTESLLIEQIHSQAQYIIKNLRTQVIFIAVNARNSFKRWYLRV